MTATLGVALELGHFCHLFSAAIIFDKSPGLWKTAVAAPQRPLIHNAESPGAWDAKNVPIPGSYLRLSGLRS